MGGRATWAIEVLMGMERRLPEITENQDEEVRVRHNDLIVGAIIPAYKAGIAHAQK